MNRVITLTTDFGTRDAYVAEMKGVLLSLQPAATIIDITHEIGPQDVEEGAFVLSRAFRWFPKDSIHIAVVDPGVGGSRIPIAVRTDNHIFIGPDNGLLSRSCVRERVLEVVEIAERGYALPEISRTFHGRDVFAPAAGHMAKGVSLSALGPAISEWVQLPGLKPAVKGELMTGRIIHIDRFGNAITNVLEPDYRSFLGDGGVEITSGPVKINALSESYDTVPIDSPLAIIGSGGELEISVNRGDMAKSSGIRRGDPVRILKAVKRET